MKKDGKKASQRRTTSDVLVERLLDWDVSVVFGLPGDGINGIMEALRTRRDRIRFVQVRHEEAATSGPGAVHLLNGLYDAKLDGAPVLAITGQTYHDLLAAPIVKPLLGKAVVPDDSPYTTGGIGLLGTLPSELAMEECDTLLMVGTSFPYLEFYPKPGEARGVQIDRDPARIGLRYPVEVGLAGDAKATLRELLPLLQQRHDRGFLTGAQQRMQEWRDLMRDRGTREDTPLKPQVVAHELSPLLDDDAIIVTDTGTVTTWVARHVEIRGTQQFACSGTLATMAAGLPYAIAAQVAFPERQVVAVVGDGGLTMLMGELATAVKYELPITVIVVKNNTYGMIKWEQMVFLGNPEYGCELQPIDFVKVAEACGARGLRCERWEDVRPTLEEALRSARPGRRPTLVEAVVDPFEPPPPPRVTLDQAVNMAKALARGERNRGRIALTCVSRLLEPARGDRCSPA